MKKAMFGLACAAAMVACADIESANIVGYASKDACANYSLGVAMFKDVGLAGLNLQNITPEGENVDGEGGLTLQTFTDSAGADAVYSWLTEEGAGVDQDGWYNEDFELAEKQLADGEGFMLGASQGAVQLKIAGEVALEEKVVEVRANYSLLGNFRPVNMPLQAVVPQGENVDGEGGLTIQTFTDSAGAAEVFSWLTEEGAGVDEDGWYNEDFELTDRVFTPGEGFMIGASAGAIQLKFKAVEL